MELDRETILLCIGTPIYAVVIGLEILMSHLHDRKWYTFKDTMSNVYLTLLNMSLDLACRFVAAMVLFFSFQHRFFTFEHSWIYWVALVFGVDFFYYWLHRADHYCRLFWAVHVTHHSSEQYNLTTGFRSSVFEPLYRFVFYIPLPLLGFEAIDIFFMHSALQIYGILVHTQSVGKLGWLEYILVTPSHHRVHHASNVRYLDKNMGMTLIIWDKIFCTFAIEDPAEPVVYGLTKNPEDRGPVNIVLHEWKNILADLRRPITLRQKLGYLFNPPGWSHDGSTKTSAQLRQQD